MNKRGFLSFIIWGIIFIFALSIGFRYLSSLAQDSGINIPLTAKVTGNSISQTIDTIVVEKNFSDSPPSKNESNSSVSKKNISLPQ